MFFTTPLLPPVDDWPTRGVYTDIVLQTVAVVRERAQQSGHVDGTVQGRGTPFPGRHPILAGARQRPLQLGPGVQVTLLLVAGAIPVRVGYRQPRVNNCRAQADEPDQGRGDDAGTVSDVEQRLHRGVPVAGQTAHRRADRTAVETRGRVSAETPGTSSPLRPLASQQP